MLKNWRVRLSLPMPTKPGRETRSTQFLAPLPTSRVSPSSLRSASFSAAVFFLLLPGGSSRARACGGGGWKIRSRASAARAAWVSSWMSTVANLSACCTSWVAWLVVPATSPRL